MPARKVDLDDLALLASAAREAGAVLLAHAESGAKVWDKNGTPVTEADLASNALLLERLQTARPDYGWLSEETQDTADRLDRQRVFVVDPLDGTVSFIKKKDDFTVALAVVDGGAPVSAVVYNPRRDELYAATAGGGATMNDSPIAAAHAGQIEGCRMIAAQDMLEHPAWPEKWPPMQIIKIGSIAYRLALVAAGRADATLALTAKCDWDIAAGELIAREAGVRVTAHDGSMFRYNRPQTEQISLLAASEPLYSALSRRVAGLKLGPRRN